MSKSKTIFCAKLEYTSPARPPKGPDVENRTTFSVLVRAKDLPQALDQIRENLLRLKAAEDSLKGAQQIFLTELVSLPEVPEKGVVLFVESQDLPVYHHCQISSAIRNVDGLAANIFVVNDNEDGPVEGEGSEPLLLVDFRREEASATPATEVEPDSGAGEASAAVVNSDAPDDLVSCERYIHVAPATKAGWNVNYRLRPGEEPPTR